MQQEQQMGMLTFQKSCLQGMRLSMAKTQHQRRM